MCCRQRVLAPFVRDSQELHQMLQQHMGQQTSPALRPVPLTSWPPSCIAQHHHAAWAGFVADKHKHIKVWAAEWWLVLALVHISLDITEQLS